MKLKIAAAVLGFIIATGYSAFAAEVVVKDGSRTVNVTEKLIPRVPAMLVVVEKGKNINDNENIFAVTDTVPDSAGLATWVFDMPDKRGEISTDGEYDLYIKQKGEAVKYGELTYTTVDSREGFKEALSLINNATELGGLLNSSDNLLLMKTNGFNVDMYRNLTSYQSAIVAKAYELLPQNEGITPANTAVAFNEAVVLTGIAKDAENVGDYLKLVNLEFEEKAYNDITDDVLEGRISSGIKGKVFNDLSSLQKRYEVINILYKFKKAQVSEIQGLLSTYAEDLDIRVSDEYRAYLDLSSYKRSKADDLIVSALKSENVAEITDLLGIIDDATEEASESSSGNSSSGGRGGGGGNTPKLPSDSGNILTSVPSTTEKSNFSDLHEASWAADAINEMADKGVVNGDGSGKFRPNDTMTREEFVKMLVIASGIYDENSTCSFNDVSENAWYYKYIASAYKNGAVTGISDTEFGIGNKLTRQDMAVLCRRLKSELEAVREEQIFTDDAQISDYAKEAVYELFKAEAISGMGDGSFSPLGTATRAQGAMIIINLFYA